MVITHIRTSDLIPYKQNCIAHDDANLALATQMMHRFGFNQPIVVDEANVIICGHGRLECAKRLGMDTVPCVVVKGLSEDEKRLYRLVDNVVSKSCEWNWENITKELDGIPASEAIKNAPVWLYQRLLMSADEV